MAVELCSEDSRSIIMSPRISFSGDVSPAEVVPVEQRNMRVSSSSSSSIDFDFCVLDYESSSADELFFDGKILPIEIKRRIGPQRKSSKPWRFRRSSSLSCGSGALCPLPLLSRSNSTGSSSPITKESFNSKPHYKKFSSSSIKQSHSVISATHYQKPPVKKFTSNGGIRINPVLNIPPASLFGLGSIFSGGKDKNKKKLSLFH
nr:uncharacterized protein LOC109177542 isoform X2 [Ipomoea batatas]